MERSIAKFACEPHQGLLAVLTCFGENMDSEISEA